MFRREITNSKESMSMIKEVETQCLELMLPFLALQASWDHVLELLSQLLVQHAFTHIVPLPVYGMTSLEKLSQLLIWEINHT